MSTSDLKQFLSFLDKKSQGPSKTSQKPATKPWNYKEWSIKEREKFLLRKKKTKLSKAKKVQRRTNGQKIQTNSKKIQRIHIKEGDNYEKNIDFLKKLNEKTKLKKGVFEKIVQNLK